MRLDTETIEKLVDLFGRTMAKEDFALLTRKFIYETICMTLVADNNKWTPDPETIKDGHYWLHELCEILDPQLTKE